MDGITNPSLREFFSKMEDQLGVIVTELPKLDLDMYIQNYVGRTRFDRLLLIGRTSVTLCVDALRLAIQEAKSGKDVSRYKQAWECIRIAAPNEPEAVRDEAWIASTEATNTEETTNLENLLKGYKNNLIKESIRIGNEDLGIHLEKVGRLNEAADAFGRMRQDVSTTKHIVDCNLRLAYVSIQRRDWSLTLNNLGKIVGVQIEADDNPALPALLKIISGVALLGLSRYEEAAKSFVETPWLIDNAPGLAHVASPNDIAVYGGLLSLLTMNREDLRERVLDNQTFRHYLESEPTIRKAVNLFVNGRYSSCLAKLESSRPDFLLDIHLQKHVHTILTGIRNKCIIQYIKPFSCVTLKSLDEAFAPAGQSIEIELVKMIRKGDLNARIDSLKGLLKVVRPDARANLQQSALEVSRQYEAEARERLRRVNLISAGLEVVSPKDNRTREVEGPTDESFFEDADDMLEIEASV